MQDTAQPSAPINNGSPLQYAVRQLDDTLAWGVGSITPPPAPTPDAEQLLLQAVLAALEPVAGAEVAFSACTDGRLPVRLQDGTPVPVREQMVGADTVGAFYAAEALGDRFYKHSTAPVADRVKEVTEFLQSNGITPSTHVGCGAAAGFTAITENVVKFSMNPAFTARVQSLLPADVYAQALLASLIKTNQERLAANAYQGLDPEVFLAAVNAISGPHAVAELKDDSRGVHGHVEEQIIRVRVPGYALNSAKLAQATGGRQVFGVNDNRIEQLARLLGRDDDQAYHIAYIALEVFADAGHATLGKDLPTFIIEPAPKAV